MGLGGLARPLGAWSLLGLAIWEINEWYTAYRTVAVSQWERKRGDWRTHFSSWSLINPKLLWLRDWLIYCTGHTVVSCSIFEKGNGTEWLGGEITRIDWSRRVPRLRRWINWSYSTYRTVAFIWRESQRERERYGGAWKRTQHGVLLFNNSKGEVCLNQAGW